MALEGETEFIGDRCILQLHTRSIFWMKCENILWYNKLLQSVEFLYFFQIVSIRKLKKFVSNNFINEIATEVVEVAI